jgi:SAM-dependent MidA family methyltransferase
LFLSRNLGSLDLRNRLIREQAFRNHEIVDVFDEPGSADLTANVDFAYLRESLDKTGQLVPQTPANSP